MLYVHDIKEKKVSVFKLTLLIALFGKFKKYKDILILKILGVYKNVSFK